MNSLTMARSVAPVPVPQETQESLRSMIKFLEIENRELLGDVERLSKTVLLQDLIDEKSAGVRAHWVFKVRKDRGLHKSSGHSVFLANFFTNAEKEVLSCLLLTGGRTVSRDRLFQYLYGLANDNVEIKIIDVFVCKLRVKLRSPKCFTVIDGKKRTLTIRTEWGMGYYVEEIETPLEAGQSTDG